MVFEQRKRPMSELLYAWILKCIVEARVSSTRATRECRLAPGRKMLGNLRLRLITHRHHFFALGLIVMGIHPA